MWGIIMKSLGTYDWENIVKFVGIYYVSMIWILSITQEA